VIVADAKYKAEKPAGFPQADFYQLLAYCTVLGLRDGHLIYAKGNEGAAIHEVRNSNVTIHCHSLDLKASPDEILGALKGISRQMLDP
jgi:5-methylcytosine-specific restriction enzyme subunit McrC